MGHFYSPVAVTQWDILCAALFQAGLHSQMCQSSLLGGSLAMEEQNPNVGTSALLFPPVELHKVNSDPFTGGKD